MHLTLTPAGPPMQQSTWFKTNWINGLFRYDERRDAEERASLRRVRNNIHLKAKEASKIRDAIFLPIEDRTSQKNLIPLMQEDADRPRRHPSNRQSPFLLHVFVLQTAAM
ncbi:unnamed protein product [Caretta caretta]